MYLLFAVLNNQLCSTHAQGPAPFLPLSAKNPINCISLHIRFYTLFQIRLNLPKSCERGQSIIFMCGGTVIQGPNYTHGLKSVS